MLLILLISGGAWMQYGFSQASSLFFMILASGNHMPQVPQPRSILTSEYKLAALAIENAMECSIVQPHNFQTSRTQAHASFDILFSL